MMRFVLVLMGCSCLLKADSGLENGTFKAKLPHAEIAYSVYGQGDVCMVVTNAWGFTKEGVRALFKPMERQFTMVYFDPRGMGGSSPIQQESDHGMTAVREDMNALREYLKLDQVNLIGWSNGAMNGLIFAAEYAPHIKKAVFVHGVAHLGQDDIAKMAEKHGPFFQLLSQAMMKFTAEAGSPEEKNAAFKDFLLGEWFPYLFVDQEKGKALLKEHFGALEFSVQHMLHLQSRSAQFDARGSLSRITGPALVIAGGHDLSPPEKVQEIEKGIPDATFAVFENSGHFAMWEEPEAFFDKVIGFLKRP